MQIWNLGQITNRPSTMRCLRVSFATLVFFAVASPGVPGASVPGANASADETPQADQSGETASTWVTSIASLGSNQFVAATADGLLLREASVFKFDAGATDKMTPIYSHPAAVWCMDATDDGSKIASVDYRGNLVVFDTASSKATTHEKAFERWCQAMLIAPDGKTVVAGNEAGKVMNWDFKTQKVGKSIELDGYAVTGLAISPDGKQLAASDGGGHVHLLKWPELESVGKIKVSEQTVWCVAYVDQGKSLLAGSSDRHLYRCEAKNEAKAKSIAKGTDWITRIAVSPSGQVAASEVGGRLHFPSTGGTDSMNAASGVWALCWNGDGQLFAGTRKDGIVMAGRSWKWTQQKKPELKKEPPAEKKAEKKSEPKKEMKAEPTKENAKKPAEKKPSEKKPAKKSETKKPTKKKAEVKKTEKKKVEKKKAQSKPAADTKKPAAEKKPAANPKPAAEKKPAGEAKPKAAGATQE